MKICLPRKALHCAIVLAALALAGCAPRQSYPPPDAPFPPAERFPDRTRDDAPVPPEEEGAERIPAPAESKGPPRSVAEASGPAVVALLDRGETLARAGQYEQAAASIERALDVEPRNPFVYRRLALLRLDQRQPSQAEALAQKSNSLAVGNAYLQSLNWELIARARRMRGDSLGAEAALSRADYYRRR